MSNLSKTIKGISAQSLVTIVMGVLELVVFAVMSRILSKSEFGLYAILQSVIMIFKSLSEAGLGSAIIQKKKPSLQFINTAFTLSVGFGAVFTIISLCCAQGITAFYKNNELLIPFCLVAASLIPYSLNSIFRGLIFKKLNFLRFGIFQIIAYSFSNAIGIIMAYNGYGVYALVVANMLNVIFQTVLLYCNSQYKPRLEVSKDDVKMILSFGGWLTLTRFLTQIYVQIDKLIVGKLLSVYTLGIFYRIRGLIDSIDSQIGGIFDTTLFPILSDLQDDKEAIKRAYLKTTYFTGIFFSYLFITFFLNADLIIAIFLGNNWIEQASLFRILSCSMFIYFLSRLNDCFIRSLAYLKFAFRLKFISIAILVSSIYLLVDYGIEGVAIAVCLTNVAICVIKTIYLCHKIDVNLMNLMLLILSGLRYSIPLIAIGICYYCLFESSIMNNIGFAVIYATITALIFVCFPSFVGKQYKEIVYYKIQSYTKNLFVKIKR